MFTGKSDEHSELSEKRVCLLTGASGTLGTAFCRMYAEKYHIAAVYLRQPPAVPSQLTWLVDPLDPLEELTENRHPIFAIQADLTQEGDLDRVVELALARFGRIDLLINAAAHSVWAPMLESNRLIESLNLQFYMNVTLPLKLSILVARKFWRDRFEENQKMNRNVVNISSIAGVRIYTDLGQSAYSASKAALNHLTFHMASEFQSIGVRVNVTAPNSFPQIVTVEDAVHSIVRLDKGDMTGRILMLDSDGERLTGLRPVKSN